MDLFLRSLRLLARPAGAAISAGMTVDSALCRASVYRLPRDVVLDTILGPAENFEYVSTTAPATPPPAY